MDAALRRDLLRVLAPLGLTPAQWFGLKVAPGLWWVVWSLPRYRDPSGAHFPLPVLTSLS